MGSHDQVLDLTEVAALRNSSRILVVASPAQLAVLTHGQAAGAMPGLKLAAHAPGEAVIDGLFADVALAVIEVDPADASSVQRIGAIRRRHPELALVAAVNGTNVSLLRTLVREGISDVVALPFDQAELLQVALDVVARSETARDRAEALAPITAIARSIGGCGATSIATHLAADLAAHDTTGRGVVIVDLDLQYGSVAEYMGVRLRGSIADLLGGQDRLDEELVRSVASDAGGGVAVIGAPELLMPLEAVNTDELLRVLRQLRKQYAHVVLDLPANWTNWTLSTLLAADAVIMVVELSIASLRQAKRRLELFATVGIDAAAVQIVVNRVEKRLFKAIDLSDVSATLGRSVLGSVSLDEPVVSAAQNQGLLVGQAQRKSRFAADVARIGDLLRQNRLAHGT